MQGSPRDSSFNVIYISYDGAGEPLGQSQILAYLTRLAGSCRITLISFEKDRTSRAETARILAQSGIAWMPLSYHRRPPVLSTLWDVWVGVRALRKAQRLSPADIVHVRSYVPALIALAADWPRGRRASLLFDIRGFWGDERVVAGSWREDSVLFRVIKRCERRLFAEADGVVTLTQASVPQIREWIRTPNLPIKVIPTCAEVERFGHTAPSAGGPRAVWCGSVGGFYRFDLALRFVKALGVPLVVLTRQLDAARAQLGGLEAEVRHVAHEEIPSELRPGDIGLCFYAEGRLANLGRAPTRAAEYLAAGMVLAASPGIGDLDTMIERHNVGVRIEDESDSGLAQAARRTVDLAADPEVRGRARRIARELYSVENGAASYLDLYHDIGRGSSGAKGCDGADH